MIDLCIKRDVLIEKQKDNTMLIVFLSLEEDTLKDTLGNKIYFGSWFQGFSLKADYPKHMYILQRHILSYLLSPIRCDLLYGPFMNADINGRIHR